MSLHLVDFKKYNGGYDTSQYGALLAHVDIIAGL